jgi:hypothetical protein
MGCYLVPIVQQSSYILPGLSFSVFAYPATDFKKGSFETILVQYGFCVQNLCFVRVIKVNHYKFGVGIVEVVSCKHIGTICCSSVSQRSHTIAETGR